MNGYPERERDHVREFFPTFEWVVHERPSPRNRPRVALTEARVGLISTAGAYVRGPQQPFDGGDAGDPSYRAVPWEAPVRFSHGGYDTRRAYRDPEVVLPRRTLDGLVAEGVVGSAATTAWSLMGYIPDTAPLMAETGPRIARELLADAVDLALLVPA